MGENRGKRGIDNVIHLDRQQPINIIIRHIVSVVLTNRPTVTLLRNEVISENPGYNKPLEQHEQRVPTNRKNGGK